MRYRFDDIMLDTHRYELWRGSEPVLLRPKVFHVLVYLLEHRDRVVSKQELAKQLWPDHFISDETLSTCITTARQAVGDSGQAQQVIQTRRGLGYRFIAPVEIIDHALDRPPEPAAVPPEPRANGSLPVASDTPTLLASDQYAPEIEVPRVGEYKAVTVLAGTVQHAEPPDAETLHHTLREFLGLVDEVLASYGGTVQCHLDDGFVALFGAPVAHEDHARRAVQAAMALRQRVEGLSASERVRVGLGLHSAQVVVDRLGDNGQRLYTLLDHSLEIARTLSHARENGGLVMSESSRESLPQAVRLAPAVVIPLPEHDTAVRAYPVLGWMADRRPLLHRPGRLSPFVDRDRELGVLQDRLQQVRHGQGQVVGIVGEPGMGKSRLLYESQRQVWNESVLWLTGHCVSYGTATPYGPIVALLRQLGELGAIDDIFDHEAELLMPLLHERSPAFEPSSLTSPAWRARTFTAIQHVWWRQSQRQPLILAIENLHWIDPTSEEVLMQVVERLSGVPILVLLTYRPGYRPLWMEKSYTTQLSLLPLSPEASRQVVQAASGGVGIVGGQLETILHKAGGNPFFLEELALAVHKQDGDEGLREVPASVQAVVTARLDRLPAEAKYVLQVAAVIGPEVPLSLLQAVVASPEAELEACLGALQRAEMLIEMPGLPRSSYAFKHALTREAAYQSLLSEFRGQMHRRILDALEMETPGTTAHQLEMLAHHAMAGAMWDKAVTYFHQAGEKAMVQSAYREAVSCHEQAMAALKRLPKEREAIEQAIDLRLNIVHALVALGQFEQCLAYLCEAETMGRVLDDQDRLRHTLLSTVIGFVNVRDYERALVYHQRVQAMTTDLDDIAFQARSHQYLGQIHYNLGEYAQAIVCLKQNVMTLRGDLLYTRSRAGIGQVWSAQSRLYLALCLTSLGEFAEGIAVAKEAMQISETVDFPYGRVAALARIGLFHLLQGNFHEAIPVLEHGMALAEDTSVLLFKRASISYLAVAYARCGRVDEAVALLEQIMERLTRSLSYAGEVFLLAGRLEDASALTWRTLEDQQQHQERGYQVHTLHLLGDIAIRRHPPEFDQAETHYQQALALANELGMRPLQAHCHRGLGTLYGQTGQAEQARAELSTAMGMYRDMGMTFWLPETETALAQLGDEHDV